MASSHRTIGPYYACRYVGDNPNPTDPNDLDDVDVVVWLLYSGPPAPTGPRMAEGVLYNRRRDQPAPGAPDQRDDRWIARSHGFGHHHAKDKPERNFPRKTEGEAVQRLWMWHRRNETPPPTDADYANAVTHAQSFVPGSGCT